MLKEISWRRIGLVAAALAVAFVSGRYFTPSKVVTKTETVTVERVVEKRVEVQSEAKERIVLRDRTVITHPDGTVEHRDISRTDNSDKTRDAKSDTNSHETIKTEVVEKIIERQTSPNWYAGVDFGFPLSAHSPLIGTPFVIANVSRRVLGPISVGAWASFDVHGQNPAGGLSVGVSF